MASPPRDTEAVIVTPLRQDLIPQVRTLMELGAPYIRVRDDSDYWLCAELFSSTCPVALSGDALAGAVIAFRSQVAPNEIYIQDVIVHPAYRRLGLARRLLNAVCATAEIWGCTRLYLTSEPGNVTAQRTWATLGFTNVAGDHPVGGISVSTDFKGPGKSRAVFELRLRG